MWQSCGAVVAALVVASLQVAEAVNLTKAPASPNERPYGLAVAFSARKASGSLQANTRVHFQEVPTNLGTGFQQSSSEFVAPVHGGYFFSFHAASSQQSDFTMALMKNGQYQVTAYGANGEFTWGSNSIFLELFPGDRIYLDLQQGSIYEHPYQEAYTTFTGFLVFPM